MGNLVYKYETPLFVIATILSVLCWAGLLYATSGGLLVFVVIMFVAYVFAQSGFIAHFRGRGVLLTASQFPDLHDRVLKCAETLGFKKAPDVYVVQHDGMLNAFATKFLFRNYVVILSDVVDALESEPDAINFYIGHEMGHIKRKHLWSAPFLTPALCLPLLGAAYSRAREYTCDKHGAACCSEDAAKKALAVLSIGVKRYRTLNFSEYFKQLRATSEFWMSFHELIASYPWLVKRIAKVSNDGVAGIPGRNPLAYLPALFVPRLNVVSLIFLYVVAIMLVGQFKAEELIKAAEQEQQTIVGEAATDGKAGQSEDASAEEDDAGNPSKAFASEQLRKEAIKATVESMNARGEQVMDDNYALLNAELEGDDRIVQNVRYIPMTSDFDFEKFAAYEKEATVTEYCDSPELQNLRDLDAEIIHRFRTPEGTLLGEVSVKPSDCQQ